MFIFILCDVLYETNIYANIIIDNDLYHVTYVTYQKIYAV
jgi:hypothetical protein